MTRIVHFEITAADVEATARFYSAAFGWSASPSPFVPGYQLLDLKQAEGTTGAVMEKRYQSQPAIVWFEVASIDETLAAVVRAGGRAVNDKQVLPDVGQLLYIADPAGTIFGLKQPD